MPKNEEFDLDKEIERISRKTNINMRNSEFSFENQIRKLDKEIDKIMEDKLKEFDDNKKLTSDYFSIDYNESTISRYREKLKKI
ncbi:hypothetical protein SAMN05216439_0862 [Methanobrevibacter gottschalkii]|uniref:Uncharacterized protein n=2 Tax=Methanobrevibacter gottschalkii TaxID=190974 RepID=A0A3N5B581_9EURY|nr:MULTISPECIES: hypothetical protein [Methanobrevibacter]MCQ2971496.1 hypothetical protein [archaeon]OEC95026.1 hypothetical protein A9505_00760 [Methanobrevibacter sp. A27]RPF52554.1 hypothetical protein EDC42_0094 [Methanobrevibacter gottschalkii DSM 11977]SEK34695.1 hypothetical protein SAMN05216439_0862 [Methanobrevibacter gottschalkii]